MQINNIMTSNGDDSYYQEDFLISIEAHLSYLKSLPTNQIKTINQHIADKYTGDFFGLLDYLGVAKQYHHVTMLVNNLLSSSDYKYDKMNILLLDTREFDLIKAVYNTKVDT